MLSCRNRLHASSSGPFADTSNRGLPNTRHLLRLTPALLPILQRTITESPLRQLGTSHLSLFQVPRHGRLQVSGLTQLRLYRSTFKGRNPTWPRHRCRRQWLNLLQMQTAVLTAAPAPPPLSPRKAQESA